jgi:hypothetical protein
MSILSGSVITATCGFCPAQIGSPDLALARINSCDYSLAAVPLCEPLTGGGGRRIVTCRRAGTTARWGEMFRCLGV